MESCIESAETTSGVSGESEQRAAGRPEDDGERETVLVATAGQGYTIAMSSVTLWV